MKKIKITTSSMIGQKCFDWAFKNFKDRYFFEEAETKRVDVLFSIFHNKIFKDDELKQFKCGYNFHGGSLPDYRGSGSPIWSIINEEKYTALTIHRLVKKIDAGEIILEKKIYINKNDTGETLYNKLCKKIFETFKNEFVNLVEEQIKPLSIDSTKPNNLYTRKDLEKAKDLTKFVRAFHHNFKEKAYYFNSKGNKIEISYE